jgi:hypothetical protein
VKAASSLFLFLSKPVRLHRFRVRARIAAILLPVTGQLKLFSADLAFAKPEIGLSQVIDVNGG